MTTFKSNASSQDRDINLEARYKLDCDCCRSLLVHVLTHEDDLVQAFKVWASAQRRRWSSDDVKAWEIERFGAEAYSSAHGRLVFAVQRESNDEPPEGWLPYKE